MIGEPRLEDRPEQLYMGIRTQVTMYALNAVIPQVLGELFTWLGARGGAPVGAPFIRYHVINMATNMDIELGLPVAASLPGDGHISAGVLPAGRYATLIYQDVARGIEANAALLDWGAAEGLTWDTWTAENGDGFGARLESFLTDPNEEPDPAKWETEVAIRLAP